MPDVWPLAMLANALAQHKAMAIRFMGWDPLYFGTSKKFRDQKSSGGGFGPEHPLEPRPGKLHAHELLPQRLGVADMDHAPLRVEIRLASPRSIIRERNADLEIRPDGHIEARQKRGSAAAKILAGSILFEGDAAGVAPTNAHRKVYRDSTFRTLLRNVGADWDHGLGPHFCRLPPSGNQPFPARP